MKPVLVPPHCGDPKTVGFMLPFLIPSLCGAQCTTTELHSNCAISKQSCGLWSLCAAKNNQPPPKHDTKLWGF